MKLATYRKSQYSDAFEAMRQGGIYILREMFDDNLTLEILQNAGCDVQHDFHIAIDSAEKAFDCAGEESYRFIVCGGYNDNIPMFELDRDGMNEMWVELDHASYTKLYDIHKELEQIEKWSGEAYCGPNVNGAGPEGDEIYQALYNIRKIIGIGVEKYTTLYYNDR